MAIKSKQTPGTALRTGNGLKIEIKQKEVVKMSQQKDIPTAQDRFIEIYYSQDPELTMCSKYIAAVEQFEAETQIKAPYKGYNSFREVLRKKIKSGTPRREVL